MENTDKKTTYKLNFALDSEQLEFLHQIINTKFNEGNSGYNMKSVFLEGLELLKEKYPNVPERISFGKRQYRGGKQKRKEMHSTSIVSTFEINQWVDDFVVMKLKDDFYYSKISFIGELVEELKLKYQGKLLTTSEN